MSLGAEYLCIGQLKDKIYSGKGEEPKTPIHQCQNTDFFYDFKIYNCL